MIKRLLLIIVSLSFVACSSVNKTVDNTGKFFFRGAEKLRTEYNFTDDEMKEWEKTMSAVIEEKAFIGDWYGRDSESIYYTTDYLRKYGMMNQKDYSYLSSFKDNLELTPDMRTDFYRSLNKYLKKLDRTYKLKDENIKDPERLLSYMKYEYQEFKLDNPSRHIIDNILSEKDKNTLLVLSNKSDFSLKDKKHIRKILNKAIKAENFYDKKSWEGAREISLRLEELNDISDMEELTKDQLNNLNAKALYIAYEDYLSALPKWKK